MPIPSQEAGRSDSRPLGRISLPHLSFSFFPSRARGRGPSDGTVRLGWRSDHPLSLSSQLAVARYLNPHPATGLIFFFQAPGFFSSLELVCELICQEYFFLVKIKVLWRRFSPLLRVCSSGQKNAKRTVFFMRPSGVAFYSGTKGPSS